MEQSHVYCPGRSPNAIHHCEREVFEFVRRIIGDTTLTSSVVTEAAINITDIAFRADETLRWQAFFDSLSLVMNHCVQNQKKEDLAAHHIPALVQFGFMLYGRGQQFMDLRSQGRRLLERLPKNDDLWVADFDEFRNGFAISRRVIRTILGFRNGPQDNPATLGWIHGDALAASLYSIQRLSTSPCIVVDPLCCPASFPRDLRRRAIRDKPWPFAPGLILIPTFLNGNHWVLFALIRMITQGQKTMTLYCWDSTYFDTDLADPRLETERPEVYTTSQHIKTYFNSVKYQTEWDFASLQRGKIDCGKQISEGSCGAHVFANAYALIRDRDPFNVPGEVDDLWARTKMIEVISESAFVRKAIEQDTTKKSGKNS